MKFMKKVTITFLGLFATLAIYSQQNLTITVTGNKNLQVAVDGKTYNLSTGTTTANKTTFAISNLKTGQHSFQVTRTDMITGSADKISSTFNLRSGYDILLRVNEDGSLEIIETKRAVVAGEPVPMSSANFNSLLKNVKNQKSVTGRRNVIAAAFNNTKNYFTTAQVSQLLQQVNSENFRLQLSKLSYRSITDRGNFREIYDQLNNEASRNELENYVSNYNKEHNINLAMSDADFNTLHQTIKQQWPVSSQMNSLTNAFNNTGNYFTTYQAGQLIQIVIAESNRLQLAKLSYRSITDKSNFYKIYELLSSQSGKDELEAYVNNYNAGSGTGVAMSDANFNNLYQTIKQQWPVSTQMNSLTNAFNNTINNFTTYQAGQLIQIVTAETNRLQLAKLSYRSITDRNNFYQIYDLLSSQASKNELESYVNNYNAGTSSDVAMSDANFNKLYQTIKLQWPVSVQMNSLTNAFNNTSYYFSTYQAGQLIQIVSAENNRLQLAKLSYRSITDKSNFYQIYDLFSNQASKDELAAYVNKYNAASNPKVPMPDADFNKLYQTIQLQFFPNERMNSLVEVFNNTNHFFTCAQAKQLIALVSFESNRLRLAKLSYRTITDRNNFSQIYELLNSQASRNELEAYVKAYKE